MPTRSRNDEPAFRRLHRFRFSQRVLLLRARQGPCGYGIAPAGIHNQGLGDSKAPLVFAIRCATAYYIPGLLDTYLNVGATERTLPGLEKMYGPAGAREIVPALCRSTIEVMAAAPAMPV